VDCTNNIVSTPPYVAELNPKTLCSQEFLRLIVGSIEGILYIGHLQPAREQSLINATNNVILLNDVQPNSSELLVKLVELNETLQLFYQEASHPNLAKHVQRGDW